MSEEEKTCERCNRPIVEPQVAISFPPICEKGMHPECLVAAMKENPAASEGRIPADILQDPGFLEMMTKLSLGQIQGEPIQMGLNDIWNPEDFAPHMAPDVERHNENVKAGRPICVECEGTGNMFMSMYKQCDDCGGLGYKVSA